MPHRRFNPLLVAKGTGTSASESQRDSDTRGRWGGLLSRGIRPLHRKLAQSSGCQDRFHSPRERRPASNGHMMMLEKNILEIAKLLDEWIQRNVR